ncbi:MAG: hypothetical protein ABI867_42290 [Kofleriaceae bacterium]
MIRSPVVLAVLVACGGSAVDAGPAYTPGMAYALHGIAPECLITKTPAAAVKVTHSCSGPAGTVTAQLGDGDRLRHLEIALVSTTLPQAKAHLEPALKPILAKADVDAVLAQLTKMRTGDRAQLVLGGATVNVAAGGPSQMAPEYSLDVVW